VAGKLWSIGHESRTATGMQRGERIIRTRMTEGLRLCATALGVCAAVVTADAKTPGATYCFLGVCHRVLTLEETRAAIGKPSFVIASFYDSPDKDRFNPSMVTSSGEIFRPGEHDSAASPNLPDGTIIAVFAPATGRGAIVRINNAGPYWGGRRLDLSRGLAERLGVAGRGIGVVAIDVLSVPTPAEATYVYARRYAAVPGYVGEVADLAAVRAMHGRCQTDACIAPVAAASVDLTERSLLTRTARRAAPASTETAALVVAEPVAALPETDRLDPDRRRNVTLLPVRLRRPSLLARLGLQTQGGRVRVLP
jgi:rare lipoprotein A